MTIKSDLLRVLAYGKGPYYQAIRAVPSYQTELERVSSDWKGKSWIESPFKFPKFTTEEFDQRRTAYQAKYGNVVNIPNFEDIIHWKLPTRITKERMAAHKFAQKRGLPSPLNEDELRVLTYKKARFLRALAVATPRWMGVVGAVENALDNAEDALVTAVVIARLAARVAPKLMYRVIPGMGWVLVGSDILNFFNIISQISFAAMGHKRHMEYVADKNPFHKKAWAHNPSKLYRVWPTFGEILEIAQTTDQMFGVGVCLGGIVGMFQDLILNDIETSMWSMVKFTQSIQAPNFWERIWGRGLTGQMIVLTSQGMIFKDDYEKTLIGQNAAAQGVQQWWKRANILGNLEQIKNWMVRVPKGWDPATLYLLEEIGYDPNARSKWPIIDKEWATPEEILYTYSPYIKENFQDYALRHKNEWEGIVAAEAAQNYYESIVSMFSDDGKVQVGRSAYANAAIDMARDILQIPFDTPPEITENLTRWIGDYERRTGQSPTPNEIETAGRIAGIEWQRTFPRITFGKAAELFPEWKAIQDQLGELYIAD